jgi:hypothetical protein
VVEVHRVTVAAVSKLLFQRGRRRRRTKKKKKKEKKAATIDGDLKSPFCFLFSCLLFSLFFSRHADWRLLEDFRSKMDKLAASERWKRVKEKERGRESAF